MSIDPLEPVELLPPLNPGEPPREAARPFLPPAPLLPGESTPPPAADSDVT